MADPPSEKSPSPEPVPGLSSLTHHCMLHAMEGIAPINGIHTVLPQSGSHNITSFCKQLALIVQQSSKQKPLPLSEDLLVSDTTIQQFFSGVLTEAEFAGELEKALVEASDVVGVDLDALHQLCWMYYKEARKSSISFPKWLTGKCTYRLWLVFNQCLDDDTCCKMSPVTMNEVLKRIIELCCYTWNDKYDLERTEDFTFPQFLNCITEYFEKFSLDTSLTCEVIADLVDETVNGVLKKGYLHKKGHKRRNWNRRWFILQRTILMYYASRDNMQLKGQLVLNSDTEVESLPDKGNRHYLFRVTCGATHKPFLISADDHKMKHDWMLAIKRAITLAKLAGNEDSEERRELESALSGFYLLKYGTNEPNLHRQDSEIMQIKHFTSKKNFRTIMKVSRVGEGSQQPTEVVMPQDEYVEMRPGQLELGDFSSDSEDEDGYYRMEKRDDILSASFSGSSVASSVGGHPLASPGAEHIFSLSVPSSIPEEFSPDEKPSQGKRVSKTGLDRGLEDSYYEECDVGTPRYTPGERYVDVPKTHKLSESESPELPRSQKNTPSHKSTTPPRPPSSSSPPTAQNEYLLILPPTSPTNTPEATPPSEETAAKSTGPPLPPRRSTSPMLPRANNRKTEDRKPADLPPAPPPRTLTLSDNKSKGPTSPPPTSPPPTSTLPPTLSPPPVPTRRNSDPHRPSLKLNQSLGNNVEDLGESMDVREDVTPFLKKQISSDSLPIKYKKPSPPPRKH